MATLRVSNREQEALHELRQLVAARYPHASFNIVEGYDPPGKYLEVHLNAADPDETFEEILDTVMERLLFYQDQRDLDVYVMPVLESGA